MLKKICRFCMDTSKVSYIGSIENKLGLKTFKYVVDGALLEDSSSDIEEVHEELIAACISQTFVQD